MPDTYQPSDEQIDALARYQNGLLETTAVWTEELEGATDLVDSPVFQSIIRAAQAEAYDEGWDDAIDMDGECPVAGPDMTCGQCATCTPPNPYRESADV